MMRMLFLIVSWASLPGHEGLDLKVSNEVPYHPLGSNLTIYCTDETSDDLDWRRGPQGNSHLSACSLTRSCLPSGQKYTVDPENRLFNMNLYNMKYSDCGTYWCKTVDERLPYKVELLEQVNNIDKQESGGTLSITTNCVLPTFTVDIQWYYIYKDGPLRIYEKPATRIEERENCQGSCGGNNAMKISSTLTPLIGGNNLIPVKFMAYVRQGNHFQRVAFNKVYMVEGCAGSPVWHIVLFILVPALLCTVCNVVLAILHRRERKPLKDIVPNLIVIWICLAMLICFGIQMAIEEESVVTDAFGTCHDNHSAKLIAVEVCCILIGIGLTAETVYHCYVKWMEVLQRTRNKQKGDELKGLSGQEETGSLLASDFVTGNFVPQKPEAEAKHTERFETEKKKECTNSLQCLPVVRNKNRKLSRPGLSTKLECTLKTDKYPSWQDPKGNVINYGGEHKFRKGADRFSWDKDEKSIEIKNIQESDAGTYSCFSQNGDVLTVELVLYLPPEVIEVNSSETATLNVGGEMTRHFPLWRRWQNLNAELHKHMFKKGMSWDADNKGLVIKHIQKEDEGEYQVCGNHLIKPFTIYVKHGSGAENERKVDAGTTVRLECSSTKDVIPSWECMESGLFNIAGEEHFRIDRGIVDKRFGWSVDKRSLLIQDIRLDDTGTYVCRHSDGTTESIIVIVRGNVQSKRDKAYEKKFNMDKDAAYRIIHKSSTNYPALALVGRTDKGDIKKNIVYQNYPTKMFNLQKDCGTGVVVIGNPSQYKEMTLECSTFRGQIQIHQLSNVEQSFMMKH